MVQGYGTKMYARNLVALGYALSFMNGHIVDATASEQPVASDLVYTWARGGPAQSCSEICHELGLECSPRGLAEPEAVYVAAYRERGGRKPGPTKPRSCSSSFQDTGQLCPCFFPTKHNALYFL